jgi:hypothetical protein
MNSVPLLPERWDWSSAIGNFLLNFGTLDYLVFVWLKDHLTTEEFEAEKKRHLKERLERIVEFQKNSGTPAAARESLAQLIARIDPIRELRNHIAHGHLYWIIEQQTQEWKVAVLQAKDLDNALLPETRQVAFDELMDASNTLVGLIEEFKNPAGFESTG